MPVNSGIYTKAQIARGTGVTPPPPSVPISAPIEIFGVRSATTSTAQAPTLAEYTSAGMNKPATGINYAFASGYHYFTLGPGTFTVIIKGAEGSSSEHGYGAYITATMVATQTVRMVALVGTAGAGSYSGGGGTFLAYTAGTDVYTSPTAILVAGGGGGGYVSAGAERDGGPTTWASTTQRKNNTDCPSYNGGVYDGGGSFSNPFVVAAYSCTTSAAAAQNFISGGRGGQQTACGSGTGNEGGFGGGGGGCPAGGGGYYGGAPGGNSPTNYGGGGGTSYRATSGIVTITSWSDTGTNGSSRSANPGTAHGYLKITFVS